MYTNQEDEMASTETYAGELEIDHRRGVIYFHSYTGDTILRICRLPKPIPQIPNHPETVLLDITHMHGCSWGTHER